MQIVSATIAPVKKDETDASRVRLQQGIIMRLEVYISPQGLRDIRTKISPTDGFRHDRMLCASAITRCDNARRVRKTFITEN